MLVHPAMVSTAASAVNPIFTLDRMPRFPRPDPPTMARARVQIKPEPSRVRADFVRHQHRDQTATDINHSDEARPTEESPVTSSELRPAELMAPSHQGTTIIRRYAQGILLSNQKLS